MGVASSGQVLSASSGKRREGEGALRCWRRGGADGEEGGCIKVRG